MRPSSTYMACAIMIAISFCVFVIKYCEESSHRMAVIDCQNNIQMACRYLEEQYK